MLVNVSLVLIINTNTPQTNKQTNKHTTNKHTHSPTHTLTDSPKLKQPTDIPSLISVLRYAVTCLHYSMALRPMHRVPAIVSRYRCAGAEAEITAFFVALTWLYFIWHDLFWLGFTYLDLIWLYLPYLDLIWIRLDLILLVSTLRSLNKCNAISCLKFGQYWIDLATTFVCIASRLCQVWYSTHYIVFDELWCTLW